MKYKLVIFDCDGVLVDSEAISCGVLAEEARFLGADLSNEAAQKKFAGTNLKFCFDYLEQELGLTLPDNFEQIYRAKTNERYLNELKPVDGIHALIQNMPLPFCVASNAPRFKIESNLNIVKLFSFFEGLIFSAYDYNAWKPDPTLFLGAAKKMGFEPQDCLVVEDSLVGVQAAISAGMQVLAYRKDDAYSDLEKAGATVIRSIGDVLKFL